MHLEVKVKVGCLCTCLERQKDKKNSILPKHSVCNIKTTLYSIAEAFYPTDFGNFFSILCRNIKQERSTLESVPTPGH